MSRSQDTSEILILTTHLRSVFSWCRKVPSCLGLCSLPKCEPERTKIGLLALWISDIQLSRLQLSTDTLQVKQFSY